MKNTPHCCFKKLVSAYQWGQTFSHTFIYPVIQCERFHLSTYWRTHSANSYGPSTICQAFQPIWALCIIQKLMILSNSPQTYPGMFSFSSFFPPALLRDNYKTRRYLRYTMWWLDTNRHGETTAAVKLTHPSSCSDLFCIWWEHLRSTLSKFLYILLLISSSFLTCSIVL